MKSDTAAKVNLAKSFPVSKDKLYKAWTEPQQLKQWWRPMDKQLTDVVNDIRPGGKVVYRFDDLEVHGEYKEAEKGSRLVYTWNWELPEESLHRGSYLLTVLFREEGEGSTLEVTQENFENEHAIKPHQAGWEEALESLRVYLTGNGAR